MGGERIDWVDIPAGAVRRGTTAMPQNLTSGTRSALRSVSASSIAELPLGRRVTRTAAGAR